MKVKKATSSVFIAPSRLTAHLADTMTGSLLLKIAFAFLAGASVSQACFNQDSNIQQYFKRESSVRMATEETLEEKAFRICNTDGEEGLTWDEVKSCEVSRCESQLYVYLLKL